MASDDEWPSGTLGDFADVLMGTSPSGDTCNETGEGLPLLNGPTEFGGHHPIAVQFTTAPVRTCQEGDILFCVRGSTAGRMNWADQSYAIGRGLAAIRHRANPVLQPFVRGVIEWRLPSLLAVATGSTFPSVSRSDIEGLECALPPLPEQKRIAHILGTLDDKIELNRRMNATLEAISRAIFKSWFVDFDPVRQKAAGKQPVGMDAQTAALFPDSFEESEMGEVPTGWGVKQVQDCCNSIQNGGTPKRSTERYWLGGKIPWLTSGEVRQPIVTATESFITEDGLSNSSAKWIPKGSTVVALYGATAGEVSMVATDMTTNQAICALIPKPKQQCFVFNSMLESREIMKSKAVGSAQQNISKGVVAETLLVLPDAELVSLFEDTVLMQLEQRIANQQQSRTLAALRDTLLPKLLSGEIRVSEAEEAVEEVLG